jgi:16S rRNA (guanine(966)-N(2))-methyltransferase RsmD
MRVITGSAKGHGLKAPKHMHLRPTPSRVKEAIFSSFNDRISGSKILELFAGTGAFSIEALSRGAESAVLVEKDRRTIGLIEQNLKKTHLQSKARVIQADVRQALERFVKQESTFDIIFADPPYQKEGHQAHKPEKSEKKTQVQPKYGVATNFSWTQMLLDSPFLPSLLAPQGILLLEYFKKEVWKENPIYQFQRDFCFGDTIVGVFTLKSI